MTTKPERLTSDGLMSITRPGIQAPTATRLLTDPARLIQALTESRDLTPQERAARADRARATRAEERATATEVPLTLDALLDKMGWTQEYAEHLVQSYCDCEAGRDGWEYCQHAYDLGLTEIQEG